MFGLTFEKLLLVMIVAAIVVGPRRLPGYVRQLTDTVRALRTLVEGARAEAQGELGVSLDRSAWTALDPRRYDPRRIVREALAAPAPTPAAADHRPYAESTSDRATTGSGFPAEILEQARRIHPGQRYLVTGSAAHPRRIRLDSLPGDDPRRLAARTEAVRTKPTDAEAADNPAGAGASETEAAETMPGNAVRPEPVVARGVRG